jgi:hypothetical protein
MIKTEPLKGMFHSSKLLTLNFKNIEKKIDDIENIQLYFNQLENKGKNPRTPENRQLFNDRLINASGYKYLIGLYGEDRSSMLKGSEIENEGRFIHLGTDIFTKDLADVYAPCNGELITIGNEPEDHSFGHYLIIKPDDNNLPYIFFGHLANNIRPKVRILEGEKIAMLGDYKNHQNGGWSRHLHLQMLSELPPKGSAPLGYMDEKSFNLAKNKFPSPYQFFPNWKIKGFNA